ncbi:hypothetical protein [Amycolatopsis palatopharyngis]|uniref:hypothetical protein n=1 Tax=Amycolatopsis palatopharyngis TaxID=187982 RepID=UPI0013BEA3C2|nr:hypothetical protein [Amycolatopsis palatopharyngis]
MSRTRPQRQLRITTATATAASSASADTGCGGRIQRDFYRAQSCAVAEVLADDMTWTHLAADEPINWIDATTLPG